MPFKSVFVLFLALVCSPGVACAQSGDHYENYFGIGAGFSKIRQACQRATAANGFTGLCDDSNSSFKLFGGYRFSRHGAVELSYQDFGKARATGILNSAAVDGRWRGYGIGLSAVGILPIGSRLEVLGKAGVMHWTADASTFLSTQAKIADSGFNFTAGAALTWFFMPQGGLRFEYERFQKVGDKATLGEYNIDIVTLSLVGRF